MIKDKIRELGFSEKEAEVYLALLEIGSAVVSDIAKKAAMKRSTVYVILKFLGDRGLISMVERRGVRLFTAASPEQLVQYLKNISSRYAGLADTAKALIPELKSSRKEKLPPPKVSLFQGSEGIKSVYEDTLASLEKIRVHADFGATVGGAEDRKTNYQAGKPDIKIQKIPLNTLRDRKRVAPNKDGLRKILLTSRAQGGFSSEMNIYDDRVVFISTNENFALIAESKEFAQALRKMSEASEPNTTQPKKVQAGKTQTAPEGLVLAFV